MAGERTQGRKPAAKAPRRQPLQYERVAFVASELVERGLEPTVRSVRTEIGFGSTGTIGAFLARWREEAAADTAAAVQLADDAPPATGRVEGGAIEEARKAFEKLTMHNIAMAKEAGDLRARVGELEAELAAAHEAVRARTALLEMQNPREEQQRRADLADRVNALEASLEKATAKRKRDQAMRQEHQTRVQRWQRWHAKACEAMENLDERGMTVSRCRETFARLLQGSPPTS